MLIKIASNNFKRTRSDNGKWLEVKNNKPDKLQIKGGNFVLDE